MKNEIVHISDLIKSSEKYDLTVFSDDSIERIEKSIKVKDGKHFIHCLQRDKKIQAKPEEIIRQLMLDKLVYEYGYPPNRLRVEHKVSFGREKKSADIVILNKSDKTSVYCVLEIKKANAKDLSLIHISEPTRPY